MADIVNLKRFRKARRRSEADRAAEVNRAAFGRTRAERDAAEADGERAARRLEAHRLTGAGRDAAEVGTSDD